LLSSSSAFSEGEVGTAPGPITAASGQGGRVWAKKFLNLTNIEAIFQNPVALTKSKLACSVEDFSGDKPIGSWRLDLSMRILMSRSSPVKEITSLPTVAAAAGSAYEIKRKFEFSGCFLICPHNQILQVAVGQYQQHASAVLQFAQISSLIVSD
jgi:hypothetical protein